MVSARLAGLSIPALLLLTIPADTNLCERSIYVEGDNVWFVSTGTKQFTRIRSRPVYVLIMTSARVAGLSMPALLLVMIPADKNLCEDSIVQRKRILITLLDRY